MRIAIVLAVLSLTAAFAGCIGASGNSSEDLDPEQASALNGSHPTYGFPVASALAETPTEDLPDDWQLTPKRDLPDVISGLELLAPVTGAGSGAGIATFGRYAYVGTYNADHFAVVDVLDPANPVVVGETDARAGDVDMIAYPDGTLLAVTATRGNIINVIDVTDPTDPYLRSAIETTEGNHNLAVLPGTPLVYNAGGAVDIWDLSDPDTPVLAGVFEEGGQGGRCHDIEFFIDRARELYRGYCAGMGSTEIWDVTDPVAPTVVSKTPYPTAATALPVVGGPLEGQGPVAPASFSHLAIVNHDASVLIMGDETGGGAAPGCDYYANVAGETTSGPLGNIWFYDITDETAPVLRGHLSLNQYDAIGSCTAHFGRTIEDTNHVAVAYYTGGVILVDFNDLDNPVIKDVWNPRGPADACTLCGVWDAWYHQGYIITGDIERGMDILTIV